MEPRLIFVSDWNMSVEHGAFNRMQIRIKKNDGRPRQRSRVPPKPAFACLISKGGRQNTFSSEAIRSMCLSRW